jgi:hypothetical protein
MIISRWMLLGMRNVARIICRKIKTYILYSISPPPRKSCNLWDNVEKCGTARQATYDNIIQRTCIAWWIIKATDSHSEYDNYCYSTITAVTRTCLNATWLSCLTQRLQLHQIQVLQLYKFLTVQFHVYDVISKWCVFIGRMPAWRWAEKGRNT